MTTRIDKVTVNGRVLRLLVLRDLKVRYAGSLLGYLWTVLDPLMMAGVYWFVFSYVLHRGAIGKEPYIIFLLAGMLPWQWARGVITDSSRAITAEAKLVRSAGIPREIWVMRLVGSQFLEYAFALPILAAFMLVLHKGISWTVFIDYPLAILITATMVFSIGLVLAPLSVLYRDLVRVVRVVLRVLFYFSPIIYSTDVARRRMHGSLYSVYEFNPFVGLLQLYRKPIFPDEFVSWVPVAKSVAAALVFLGIGVWVFRRLQGTVLKEI